MEIKLNASSREVTKKKVKSLRKERILPAAIYGYRGNFNIQLNHDEFAKSFKKVGHTGLIDLNIGDDVHTVLVDEVQINPMTRDFIHVSLREVRMDVEINANVPLELVGEEVSPAVKEEQSLIVLTQPTIEVSGLPRSIPNEIKINVESFHAGDTIQVKDLTLPQGVELVRKEDAEIVIVTTTSAVQDEIIEDVNAAIAEAVATESPEGETGSVANSEESPTGKKE
jgi:large subunit ribosomal protein L25